jgi:hypothetical protein
MSDPLYINAGRDALVGTATIEADNELLTIAGHGLVAGDTVTVDSLTGGAAGVLVVDAVYFVRDATTDSFGLSLTPHGPLIVFAADGGADVYRYAPQYHAAEMRRLLGGLLQRGDALGGFAARSGLFPNGSVVSGASAASLSGTTWTVHNVTGVIHTGITSLTGPYLFAHPEESGSVVPADATNPRIDALDLQIQDHDQDGSGFRRARVVYATGVPGVSPADPPVTANSLRVATILVPANGSPSPTLTVVAPYTVAVGGTIPVRDSDDYPGAGGRYQGMLLWDVAQGALVVNQNAGGTWVPIGGPGASPPTVQDFDDVSIFQFTNTAFDVLSSSGIYVDCGVAFVAPISGRVMIHWTVALDIVSGTNAVAYCSPVVRTGGTVGSGSVVLPAADNNSRRVSRSSVGTDDGGSRNRSGASYLLESLTAGNTYNVRLEHRVTSQTGEMFHRAVQVVPAT